MDLSIIHYNIVVPALSAINLYSDDAARLVTGTGLTESEFIHTHQIGGGPALGWWQVEPATHDDIFTNFLGSVKNEHILNGLNRLTKRIGDARELAVNPLYGAAIARIVYYRRPDPLPDSTMLVEMARYYKKHYNTPLGKATIDDFCVKAAPVMEITIGGRSV